MAAIEPDVPPIEIVLLGRHRGQEAEPSFARAKSIVADEIRNRSKRQRPPNWVCSAKMMSRSTPSRLRRAASGGRLGSVASANIISCLPRFWLRRAVVWSGRGFRNGRSQAGDATALDWRRQGPSLPTSGGAPCAPGASPTAPTRRRALLTILDCLYYLRQSSLLGRRWPLAWHRSVEITRGHGATRCGWNRRPTW
jgi:hypothetical protein